MLLDRAFCVRLPTQDGSSWDHIRGYGCYAYVLLAILQILAKVILTQKKIEAIIRGAISEGIIWDNDVPINEEERAAWEKLNGKPCPEWFRIFVKYPEKFIRYAAGQMGISLDNCQESLPRLDGAQAEPESLFTIIDWWSLSLKTGKALGSHFELGPVVDGKPDILFDPGPAFFHKTVRTTRGWFVTLKGAA
jgi:hypothetical protein